MAAEAPHVLAVDDSIVDRKVIERLLKISSCRVTTVDSGRRALQFLGLDGEQKPVGVDSLEVNLIITDYCMPGMNGYELLKKIKESSTLREIPVVIMSSENVVARIDRCLEEGAEEFIMKPVKLSDLKRLKGYIAKKQRREEGGDEGKQAQSHKRPLPLSSPSPSSPPPSSTTSPATPPSSTTSPSTPSPPPPPSTTSPSTPSPPPVSSPSPSSTTSTAFQEHDAITSTSPSSSQPPQKMARLNPQSVNTLLASRDRERREVVQGWNRTEP